MGRKDRRGLPAALARAQRRFVAWRGSRKLGTRIPEPLWALAVKLATTHGVCRTAETLGLGYDSLKKRVQQQSPTRRSPASAKGPAFVEVGPPPLAALGECLIEFEAADGNSMRVHLKGHETPDVLALGRGFWNGE